MLMQNSKTKMNANKEVHTFLDLPADRVAARKTLHATFLFKIFSGVFVLLLIVLNIIAVYTSYTRNNQLQVLQDEIDSLRRDVDALSKYRFVDVDLLNELKAYENEVSSDSDVDENASSDDPDYDSDFNYEYEEKSIEEIKEISGVMQNKKNLEILRNRNKREVLAATLDGVPIIAESYAEQKQRNKTYGSTGETLKLYDTLGKSTVEKNFEHTPKRHLYRNTHSNGWTPRTYVNHGRDMHVLPGAIPTPVMSRKSRVMHTNEDKSKAFRKVVKKSLVKSSGTTPEKNYQEHVAGAEATANRDASGVVSINRRRKHGAHGANLETMDERHPRGRRNLPVAHFSGDASKYVYGQHQHYKGNGRLAHPEGLYIDWAASTWVKSLGMDRFFHLHNGVLTVKDTGLYFLYAQIYYSDEHDMNGYRIHRNDTIVAQCTTMTHSQHKLVKGNTCYTATVEYLTEGDKITVKDIENMRYSLFEPGKSFFGLVKISDAKIK